MKVEDLVRIALQRRPQGPKVESLSHVAPIRLRTTKDFESVVKALGAKVEAKPRTEAKVPPKGFKRSPTKGD